MIEIKKTLKNFLVKKEVVRKVRSNYTTNVVAEKAEQVEGILKERENSYSCEKACDSRGSMEDILDIEETITIEEVK